jgi:dipeptidyl aminopeptidase/acylaminoacyl peptidase
MSPDPLVLDRRVLPFGSWPSPITASLVASGGVGLDAPTSTPEATWWLETRSAGGGRSVLVRAGPGQAPADVTPRGFSVRTRVHEYGGGAYVLRGDAVFFSNFDDQRLYRQDAGRSPVPLTPEPARPASIRYADGAITPDGRAVVCIRERHEGSTVRDVVNELVAVPTDGSGEPRIVASGRDFYSDPRVSPEGRRLAWLAWDHPRMPWDGTELWVADLASDGALSSRRLVAGGPGESIFQPSWSPQGVLHFVSDTTGWWNLYREVEGRVEPLYSDDEEFGEPAWVFGRSMYAFLPDGRIACIHGPPHHTRLGILDPATVRLRDLAVPFTTFEGLRSSGWRLAFVGGSPTVPPSVISLDARDGSFTELRTSMDAPVDPRFASTPRHIEFPTEGGVTAHATYYPPASPVAEGPPGERPPLLVIGHGGPTSHSTPSFDPRGGLFWTSRGFGVVDVNYRGSTGYGRAYRDRLAGGWGIVDVEDCVNAAKFLAGRGEVDGSRMAIRGGSAGGYAALCALAFHDVFAAGASYFGVADVEALARDTHKFESRYLDGLIAPYPEGADVYRLRSPLHFADRIRVPLILFQGLEDPVVPPSQAEAMVEALRANGVPHAYLTFEGEQHGFRKAETIQRTLEAELSFYGNVFGFEPADPIDPIPAEGFGQ